MLLSNFGCLLIAPLGANSYVLESKWNGFHEQQERLNFRMPTAKRWQFCGLNLTTMFIWTKRFIRVDQVCYWNIHLINRYWLIANGIGFVTQHTQTIRYKIVELFNTQINSFCSIYDWWAVNCAIMKIYISKYTNATIHSCSPSIQNLVVAPQLKTTFVKFLRHSLMHWASWPIGAIFFYKWFNRMFVWLLSAVQ